jgi:hypothetical protein
MTSAAVVVSRNRKNRELVTGWPIEIGTCLVEVTNLRKKTKEFLRKNDVWHTFIGLDFRKPTEQEVMTEWFPKRQDYGGSYQNPSRSQAHGIIPTMYSFQG